MSPHVCPTLAPTITILNQKEYFQYVRMCLNLNQVVLHPH